MDDRRRSVEIFQKTLDQKKLIQQSKKSFSSAVKWAFATFFLILDIFLLDSRNFVLFLSFFNIQPSTFALYCEYACLLLALLNSLTLILLVLFPKLTLTPIILTEKQMNLFAISKDYFYRQIDAGIETTSIPIARLTDLDWLFSLKRIPTVSSILSSPSNSPCNSDRRRSPLPNRHTGLCRESGIHSESQLRVLLDTSISPQPRLSKESKLHSRSFCSDTSTNSNYKLGSIPEPAEISTSFPPSPQNSALLHGRVISYTIGQLSCPDSSRCVSLSPHDKKQNITLAWPSRSNDYSSTLPKWISPHVFWMHYQLETNTLDEHVQRLRTWIATTVLKPLVAKIDRLNQYLAGLSRGNLQIGQSSVASLQHLLVSRVDCPETMATLQQLFQYLLVSTNQHYLVDRLKHLASDIHLRDFKWNSGGKDLSSNGPWGEYLPTDCALIWHVLCTYLDGLLPAHSLALLHRPFTSQFTLAGLDTIPSPLQALPDAFYVHSACSILLSDCFDCALFRCALTPRISSWSPKVARRGWTWLKADRTSG